MLSIPSLQKMVLFFLPTFQLNLAYSALVCYELFFIAVLHYCCWDATADDLKEVQLLDQITAQKERLNSGLVYRPAPKPVSDSTESESNFNVDRQPFRPVEQPA